MLFPINYKLGEREEDNLSVKFKPLTNKREMFEAELPCLGKKELLHSTLENHKSVHTQMPPSPAGAVPQLRTQPSVPCVSTEPEWDQQLGSSCPSLAGGMVKVKSALWSCTSDTCGYETGESKHWCACLQLRKIRLIFQLIH